MAMMILMLITFLLIPVIIFLGTSQYNRIIIAMGLNGFLGLMNQMLQAGVSGITS